MYVPEKKKRLDINEHHDLPVFPFGHQILVNSPSHMQNILTTSLRKITQKSTPVIELGNPALSIFFMNPEDNGETGIR